MSLANNVNAKNNYEVWILEQEINEFRQQLVTDMLASYSNISVTFINVDAQIEEYGKHIFYEHGHFSKAVYYRLFISNLFPQYDKILYLDSDIIIKEDVANLFNIDIGNHLLGATRDLVTIQLSIKHTSYHDYHQNILKIKDIANYLQSGILVMNLNAMRKFELQNKSLAKLEEIKAPRLVDQDILSVVCEGNIYYLPAKWNCYWTCGIEKIDKEALSTVVFPQEVDNFLDAIKNPSIIHYITGIKPWNSPYIDLSQEWWHYARQTPMYEEILYKYFVAQQKVTEHVIKEVGRKNSLQRKYYLYTILSKITFGKLRVQYKQQRQAYKDRLNKIKIFLKG